jgi:N-acetyl-anhydromuramyl-L-alanine amidase AmpD
MKIVPQMLDSCNAVIYNGISIGDAIKQAGKFHLWEERVTSVDVIVIHYISAINVNEQTPFSLPDILQIFVDYGVSSHYLIARDGLIFQLVPEEKKAWHCGPSIMPPPDCRKGVNDFSIGIELIGTETSGFTQQQYESLCLLCCQIESNYNKVFTYVGHEHIAGVDAVNAGLRKLAKTDPGPLFDWTGFSECMKKLRAQGKLICQDYID